MTAVVVRITPHTTGEVPSVPAVTKCIVAITYSGNARACVRRQTLAGSRRRASDVSSTATSRWSDTTPHAIHTGCHDDANGTNTSTRLNWMYESAMIDTMCTAVNTTARPPRNRCRSRVQFGRNRGDSIRFDNTRPHSVAPASNAQATMPAARALYHQM
jgi:hypothetical protein